MSGLAAAWHRHRPGPTPPGRGRPRGAGWRPGRRGGGLRRRRDRRLGAQADLRPRPDSADGVAEAGAAAEPACAVRGQVDHRGADPDEHAGRVPGRARSGCVAPRVARRCGATRCASWPGSLSRCGDREPVRHGGGRCDVILDVAAWAVPFGLIGVAAGAVIHGGAAAGASCPDPWSAARVWDGAVGVPGAVGLGAPGPGSPAAGAGVQRARVAGAAARRPRSGRPSGAGAAGQPEPPTGAVLAAVGVKIVPGHRVPGMKSLRHVRNWCSATKRWARSRRRATRAGPRSCHRRPGVALELAPTFGGCGAAESLPIAPAPRGRRPAGRPAGGTGYDGRRGRRSVPYRCGGPGPSSSGASQGAGRPRQRSGNRVNLGAIRPVHVT